MMASLALHRCGLLACLLSAVVAPATASAWACASQPADASELEALLRSHPDIAPLVDRASDYRLQVLLAEWATEPDGAPCLRYHAYRVGAEYSYPAGAVIPFVAAAAMQQLQEAGGAYGLNDALFADDYRHEREDGTAVTVARAWESTLDREIRRLSVLSMAQAFNRIYDLVGHAELNQRAWAAGYGSVRLPQRMDEELTPDDNRWSPTVRVGSMETPLVFFPQRRSRVDVPAPVLANPAVGTAWLGADGETIVPGPMSFSGRNHVSLPELMGILFEFTFPDELAVAGYTLTDTSRTFLATLFSLMPADAGIADTDTSDPTLYPVARHKPMMPGIQRILGDAATVQYTSQVGRGFGFTTEAAVVQLEGVGRFAVAATLYTNEDGIVNDDRYEYGTIADPFLADLGEVLARRFLVASE